MDIDISSTSRKVVGAVRSSARLQSLGWLLVKVIFIVGASSLAGVAQFLTVSRAADLTIWHSVGIIAAAVAGLGGIILAIKEKDAGAELAASHEALEAARTLKSELRDALTEYDGQAEHLVRLRELYLAIRAMRSVLERSKGVTLSDVFLIKQLLSSAKRSLSIALDFRLQEHWTLTVYRAEKDAVADRWELVAIVSERSTICELGKARRWPEGIGPGGQCLASGLEVGVPDATLEGMASILDIGPLSRQDDTDLYRSMFAAPILLPGNGRPWGVVMASSSRPEHFECRGTLGVRRSEAVRVLADMIALALVVQSPKPSLEPAPTSVPVDPPKGGSTAFVTPALPLNSAPTSTTPSRRSRRSRAKGPGT